MRHFCTLFDRNYLVKGVAMLRSLQRHCPTARVHVLCMDEETREMLKALAMSHVSCLSLAEVETPELLAVKPTRSVAEYCWTLSPCLPWYVLQKNPAIDAITYIDADLYFYSALQPLFDEIGTASIVIVEHRFPPSLKHLEIRGRFCVQWVSFRRDEEGLACLSRWRNQCLDWCFYRLEAERMGDQKYLDSWPADFRAVHILQHIGGGVAPWNFGQYEFWKNGDGLILVDGVPLIFYHFHQFQILSNGRFNRISGAYKRLGREPESVYVEYEEAISCTLEDVRRIRPGFSSGIKPALKTYAQSFAQAVLPTLIKEWLKNSSRIFR